MALFDLGTPMPNKSMGERYVTPKPGPAKFRPIGRIEGSDPEIRALYQRQKKQWEKEVEESRKEDKEAKKAYESQMKSQYGNQWRKRVAEQGRAKEYASAQQALDERATVNRGLRETELPPMPEEDAKGDEMVDIPGGGKASADTVRMLYGKKQERDAASEKTKAENRQKVYKFADTQKAAAKQRYEEELASRGFTPPKTREEENVYNRERMADFREGIKMREDAKREEQATYNSYRDYKMAAREARANKRYVEAEALDKEADFINESAGGNITNATSRGGFFENKANKAIKDQLQKKAEDRIALRTKQTSANPEAGDFRPKSTGAPIGVGAESLSYNQRPQVGDAMEQPFGIVPPTSEDRGVDFGAISPANVRGAGAAPETPPPAETPADQPFRPPTSATQTEEDILPGISEMPAVPRDPNETPAQHNARVLEEYENSVILPSLSEEVQSAFLSAKELNEQEKALFAQRFTSPENRKRYNEIAKQAKEQHDILKSEIDALRKNSRNLAEYPLGSSQRTLNDQKIATLRKQLGFFAKRLY